MNPHFEWANIPILAGWNVNSMPQDEAMDYRGMPIPFTPTKVAWSNQIQKPSIRSRRSAGRISLHVCLNVTAQYQRKPESCFWPFSIDFDLWRLGYSFIGQSQQITIWLGRSTWSSRHVCNALLHAINTCHLHVLMALSENRLLPVPRDHHFPGFFAPFSVTPKNLMNNS